MNCENFAGKLPEYLDGALSATEQAAAQEHIQKCGVCQSVLAREEAFAKSLRLSFERETQGLSLRPETKRNILNAWKRQERQPTLWESIQRFLAIMWQHPFGIGAVVLCLLLTISGRVFHAHSRNVCVIDVPIQTEVRVYRAQNNTVIDSVMPSVTVIDGTLSEN